MATAHRRAVFARVAAALVLGLGALSAAGCKNRQNPTAPTDPGTKEPDRGYERVIAEDLDEEFDEDRAAATAKYKNRVIEVTGKVHKVHRTGPDAPSVEVGTGDETVDCDFADNDAPQLDRLRVGQEVVIRGKCVGLVKGTVTLEQCTVVK